MLNTDLLYHVFKHLTPTGTRREIFKSREPLNLCQVSRTFREVARSSPVLWTAVSNRQSLAKRTLYLTLSGQEGLRIFLIIQHEELDEYADFVREVVPHSDRWTEFYFRTGKCLSDHLIAIRTIAGLTYRLHLPRLNCMTLCFPLPNYYDTDGECLEEFFGEGEDSERFLFFRLWVLPSLKSLKTKNITSLRNNATTVEELEMYGENIDRSSLAHGTWPSLTSLSIRTKHYTRWSYVDYVGVELVYMSNLRILDIVTSADSILRLTAQIRYPQLRELRMALLESNTVAGTDERTRLGFFTKLFNESPDLAAITSFQFVESQIKENDPFPFQTFTYVLSRLPCLRHFYLTAAGPEFPSDFSLQVPALETLTLRSNPFLDVANVLRVRDALLRGPTGTFRTFDAVDCPNIHLDGEGVLQYPTTDLSLGTDGVSRALLDPMYDSDPEPEHSGYLHWTLRDTYNFGRWNFTSDDEESVQTANSSTSDLASDNWVPGADEGISQATEGFENDEKDTRESEAAAALLSPSPRALGAKLLSLFEPPNF